MEEGGERLKATLACVVSKSLVLPLSANENRLLFWLSLQFQ